MNEPSSATGETPFSSLGEIEVMVSARLGAVRMPLCAAAALCEGSIVALDCPPDAPVALLVNGVAIARGELVVTDDGELAVEISEVRP